MEEWRIGRGVLLGVSNQEAVANLVKISSVVGYRFIGGLSHKIIIFKREK